MYKKKLLLIIISTMLFGCALNGITSAPNALLRYSNKEIKIHAWGGCWDTSIFPTDAKCKGLGADFYKSLNNPIKIDCCDFVVNVPLVSYIFSTKYAIYKKEGNEFQSVYSQKSKVPELKILTQNLSTGSYIFESTVEWNDNNVTYYIFAFEINRS